jgi:aldehyde dehydrogenase (NAD+)
VNIVTGWRDELAEVLARHDDVDAVWYCGPAEGGAAVERLSVGNMKRTWVDHGRAPAWDDLVEGAGEEFLRRASNIKNIWIPYGE